MSKIHYATGGLITPEKAEFSTMCGRKFKTGGKEIMDSGYAGALRVTCEDCRFILDLPKEQEYSWYEVTDGKGMGSERMTLEQAKKELSDMRRGFSRKHPNMKEDDRLYWKKAGKRNYVVKITEVTKVVSY